MLSRMVCAGGSNERVLETKFGVLLMPRWHSEEALSFLGRLLADPWAEHLLVGSVKPTEALYDQDIFELVALVDDIKRFEAPKIQDPSARGGHGPSGATGVIMARAGRLSANGITRD